MSGKSTKFNKSPMAGKGRLGRAKVVGSQTIKIQMTEKPSMTRTLLSTPVQKNERKSPGMMQSREVLFPNQQEQDMRTASTDSIEMMGNEITPLVRDPEIGPHYETIQDRYVIIRYKYEAWRVRTLTLQTKPTSSPEREYVLYYKMGDLFIRPMGLFTGVIGAEFSFIWPYSLRRGNGEIGLLPFLANENVLVVDRHYVTRITSTRTNITNTIVEPRDAAQVYIFGETHRGIRFAYPSFLELKGQLAIVRHVDRGSPVEERIRSHCTVNVMQGSVAVFICDFKSIVLVLDVDCLMTIKLAGNDQQQPSLAVQISGKDLQANSKKNPIRELTQHIQQTRIKQFETEMAPKYDTEMASGVVDGGGGGSPEQQQQPLTTTSIPTSGGGKPVSPQGKPKELSKKYASKFFSGSGAAASVKSAQVNSPGDITSLYPASPGSPVSPQSIKPLLRLDAPLIEKIVKEIIKSPAKSLRITHNVTLDLKEKSAPLRYSSQKEVLLANPGVKKTNRNQVAETLIKRINEMIAKSHQGDSKSGKSKSNLERQKSLACRSMKTQNGKIPLMSKNLPPGIDKTSKIRSPK